MFIYKLGWDQAELVSHLKCKTRIRELNSSACCLQALDVLQKERISAINVAASLCSCVFFVRPGEEDKEIDITAKAQDTFYIKPAIF